MSDQQERKFTTAYVVYAAFGSLAAVGLLLFGLASGSGTPVILVGGSVKLQTHNHILGLEFVHWKPEDSGDGWRARGKKPIASISIQYPNGTEYQPIDTTGKDISLTINVALCGLSITTIQVNQLNSDHIIHATPPSGEKFVKNSTHELEYKHTQKNCQGGGTVL